MAFSYIVKAPKKVKKLDTENEKDKIYLWLVILSTAKAENYYSSFSERNVKLHKKTKFVFCMY